MAIAALLKADRNAAMRGSLSVATWVDTAARMVRSEATGRVVQLPNDVSVETLLPGRCGQFGASPAIRFFASGISCGGAIALTRTSIGYEIRINWLTGGVEIVPFDRS